jgi:hypothetical protein
MAAVEQRATQASSLPVVGDDDRDLGIVVRAAAAGDAPRLPARIVDRDDCLVGEMVDVNEAVKFSRRQLGLAREEPPVAQLLAQPLDHRGETRLVLGLDRAQRHPRTIAQSDRPASEEVDIACSAARLRRPTRPPMNAVIATRARGRQVP